MDLGVFGYGSTVPKSNAKMQDIGSAHITLAARSLASSGAAGLTVMQNFSPSLTCSGYSDCLSKYLNFNSQRYGWYNQRIIFTHDSGDGENGEGAITDAASELLRNAIQAAADYLNGGTGDSTVIGEIQNTVQDSRTESVVQEYIYAQLSVTDFSEDGYINNLNFVCENCASSGITYNYMEFYNASNEWERVSSSTNLLNALNSDSNGLKNGNIRIRVHITKQVEDDDCSNASYRITYDYMDPNKQYVGARLKAARGNNLQRMVIIDEV